jgi:glyoxylase-like metal-dependent hydrolase (beta-lactamase superfamily II)/ferredoxin
MQLFRSGVGGAAATRRTPAFAVARSSSSSRARSVAVAVIASSSEGEEGLDWSKAPTGPRKRRAENVDGAGFWVDDKCISCRVCRRMAPEVFGKVGPQSAVLRAPSTDDERRRAWQASLSCPTFSIHAAGPSDAAALRDARDNFPIPAFPGSQHVFSNGFTDIKAIATWSYFLRRDNGEHVLFDAPRFVPPVVASLARECGEQGPSYFVLSHRDDIGEHERWAAKFPRMRRVVHEREADAVPSLRDCEVILRGEGPWRLPDGGDDVLVVLTPGHTSGSITLLYAPESAALTGDHLDGNPPANEFGVVPPPPRAADEAQELHVFRDYCWDSFGRQLESVAKLAGRGSVTRVLPGHGSPALFGSPEEFDAAVGRLLAAELKGGAEEAEAMLARAKEALAREPAPIVPQGAEVPAAVRR